MAFALKSKSNGKAQGADKSAPKQKSARELHSADSKFGFETPVFQSPAAVLPGMPMIQAKLKTGEPARPSQSGVLQRKCACGGATGMSGGCEECNKKQRLGLQTKLKVNEPGDAYEQEADRIADKVMAAPAKHDVSMAPLRIQRFSKPSNGHIGAAPASVDHALASPSRPLEPALQQDMEQRFGYDFHHVRVHTGPSADRSAEDLNADAYTVGHDIVFGTGRFAPRTHKGRQLLTHELTHVVQQAACGVASLQRKEKETDDRWPTLARAADRLSMASAVLYKLEPHLIKGVIEPESRISGGLTKQAVESKVARPMGGPAEKIKSPFSDYLDLQETLRTFESSLTSHLHAGAEVLLDATEEKLKQMSKLYSGSGEHLSGPGSKRRWERITSFAASQLQAQLEVLRQDPDVIKLEIDHVEHKKAMAREVTSQSSFHDIVRYPERLEKERQQYNESLKQLLKQKSPLYLLAGSDVAGLLNEKSASRAQEKLEDLIADGGMKVQKARKKLGDRRFLYSADILIATVKEHLAEWLGPHLKSSVVGENPELGPRFREAEFSRRVRTVNEIIDRLAKERKAEKTIWEDIVKVLEVLSAFVPGPIGWGIRIGVAAAGLHMEMGRIEEQRTLYGPLSNVAPDSNAKLKAAFGAPIQFLPDAALAFKAAKSARPLTHGVKDLSGSVADEAATMGQRSAANLGERELTNLGERGVSQVPPKPVIAEPVPPAIPRPTSNRPVALAGGKPPEIKPAPVVAPKGVNDKTVEMLTKKRPDLAAALAKNPRAAEALTLCHSFCIPEFATTAQVERIEKLLANAESRGLKLDKRRMKEYFHRAEDQVDLTEAIDEFEKAMRKARPNKTPDVADSIIDEVELLQTHGVSKGKPLGVRLGEAREGNLFDTLEGQKYPHNQIPIRDKGDKIRRLDSYDPGKQEIISRKSLAGSNGQIAFVEVLTMIEHFQEFALKYPNGAVIANTKAARRMGLSKQILKGQYVLEVPVQNYEIPKRIIEEANARRIKIRDIDGKVYN